MYNYIYMYIYIYIYIYMYAYMYIHNTNMYNKRDFVVIIIIYHSAQWYKTDIVQLCRVPQVKPHQPAMMSGRTFQVKVFLKLWKE